MCEGALFRQGLILGRIRDVEKKAFFAETGKHLLEKHCEGIVIRRVVNTTHLKFSIE
jgi:hypothetical protein